MFVDTDYRCRYGIVKAHYRRTNGMDDKRTVRVEINLTEIEATELRDAARNAGLQTATFVRIAAVKAARRGQE